MWAQYDHVLAHARGGDNSIDNTILTCAPCNFGKMNYTLEELNLVDPRVRPPVASSWDGLERLLKTESVSRRYDEISGCKI
ncbi:HNH endonuclease [Pseudomonas syringae]|nr:HNH endonuclease [Pseudomonas syringae]